MVTQEIKDKEFSREDLQVKKDLDLDLDLQVKKDLITTRIRTPTQRK